jgi:hypothetical protein
MWPKLIKVFVTLAHQDYLELNKGSTSLLCSTDKPFEIVFDSEGLPEKEEEDKEKTEEKVCSIFCKF